MGGLCFFSKNNANLFGNQKCEYKDSRFTNPAHGTRRVCVRTGPGTNQIVKYGLTTHASASKYCGFKMRMPNGSIGFLGMYSSYTSSSSTRDEWIGSWTVETNSFTSLQEAGSYTYSTTTTRWQYCNVSATCQAGHTTSYVITAPESGGKKCTCGLYYIDYHADSGHGVYTYETTYVNYGERETLTIRETCTTSGWLSSSASNRVTLTSNNFNL